MDCRPRDRSQQRTGYCRGQSRRKEDLFCDDGGNIMNIRTSCNKSNEQKRYKKKDKAPVDFYQVITKVKSRMDNTFRSLEGGLRGVEKSMNDDVAKVLAQVIEFEESMKPKLLIPYKKCKELESIVTPVLCRTPKRPATANCRGPQKAVVHKEHRSRSSSRPSPCRPPMAGRERYKELMCCPSLDRVNPWEGSEDQYDPNKIQQDSSHGKDSYRCSTPTESSEDEVGRTLKELQGISISVNKSLKRINEALSGNQDLEKMKRTVERKPEVLNRVNESLNHIGAGARLMKRLLAEGRSIGNC